MWSVSRKKLVNQMAMHKISTLFNGISFKFGAMHESLLSDDALYHL